MDEWLLHEPLSIYHESHQIFPKESHTVVNKFASLGTCRNHRGNHIAAAELILFIIISATIWLITGDYWKHWIEGQT